jgi:hypothetical protein
MSRQPLLSLASIPGDISIGPDSIGRRPILEAAIAKCVMAWPYVENGIAVLLGFLLKAENDAALAVFHSLRRSSAQYSAVSEAAAATLNDPDQKLLSAVIRITQSTESLRNDLVHGHFGDVTNIPDGILWIKTNDYVRFVIKAHLHHVPMSGDVLQQFYSKVSVYKLPALVKIHSEINELIQIWFNLLEYLRLRTMSADVELVDAVYQRLCGQPRIAQALEIQRQRDIRLAQLQLPKQADDEKA